MVMMMLLSLFIVVMQKTKKKHSKYFQWWKGQMSVSQSAKFKSQNRILVHDMMMMIKPIFMCNKPVKKKAIKQKKIHEQNTREAS